MVGVKRMASGFFYKCISRRKRGRSLAIFFLCSDRGKKLDMTEKGAGSYVKALDNTCSFPQVVSVTGNVKD